MKVRHGEMEFTVDDALLEGFDIFTGSYEEWQALRGPRPSVPYPKDIECSVPIPSREEINDALDKILGYEQTLR